MFIQHVFEEENIFSNDFIRNVIFTSGLEEFFKWLILLLAIYRHVEFEDAYDGILYGASVSLGFATVENIIYLLTFGAGHCFSPCSVAGFEPCIIWCRHGLLFRPGKVRC